MATYNLQNTNLFMYCSNNPISRDDKDGEFWNFVIGAAVGAVIGAALTAVDILSTGGELNGAAWAKIGISALAGAASGLMAASGAGLVVQMSAGALIGGAESVGHQLIDNGKVDSMKLTVDVLAGAAGGLIGGSGAINGSKYMTQQASRFVSKAGTSGIKTAGKYFYKMTANYSKGFVSKTVYGLAKGFVGNSIVKKLLK